MASRAEWAGSARNLVSGNRWGVLSTLSERLPGFPQGSVMPYSLDDLGRPVLFLSRLALHTANLAADPRASLLVAETEEAGGNPLGLARVNLFGAVAVVDGEEAAALLELHLRSHPEAAQWRQFPDFRIFRMEVEAVYFVGGFGRMGWVEAGAYRNGAPPGVIKSKADADHPGH